MPSVSSTLPSSVQCLTVWSPSSVSQSVSSAAMWTPCARRTTPSPHERRKLPSRSNTTIGCWPRLNAYTRSCLSTPTASTSALNSRPGGSLAHWSTTPELSAPVPSTTVLDSTSLHV